MRKMFFSVRPYYPDLGILVLRICAGGIMAIAHGWPKLANYAEKSQTFKDVFGIGSEANLILAILAEFFCGLLITIGLFTRLASVPLFITMFIAFFLVHAADPFQKKELALLYMLMYVILILTGPGKYSADFYFCKDKPE
ncbi:MAG: DoxX family protein [Cytophagaceae bacterium]